MAIQWTEDLTTGSDEIDEQHKEIFRRINALLDACSQGKGKAEVCRVIGFLDDYVVTHFGEEEAYMLKHNYPGYAEHKAKHVEFVKNYIVLKKQVEAEGPGLSTVVATNRMVVDWLRDHIRKMDTQIAAFRKNKQQ
jgi:hemerythrin-like metal-binding protein